MATIKRFEEIEAWKVARELCAKLGVLIDGGAFKTSFKLIGQIDASSGSIMDNIAEGFERNSRDEFINFLSYAKGSSGELKSQLYRAENRKYITKELFDELYEKTDKVGRKIGAHMEYLKQCEYRGTKFKDRLQIPKTAPNTNKGQPSKKQRKDKGDGDKKASD